MATHAVQYYAHTAHCACVERALYRRLARVTIGCHDTIVMKTIEMIRGQRLRPQRGRRGEAGPELGVVGPIAVVVVVVGPWH